MNRLLTMKQQVKDQQAQSLLFSRIPDYSQEKSEMAQCPQYSVEPVGTDAFILDILQFFFEERLSPEQLNTNLRQVAADAVWRASQEADNADSLPECTTEKPDTGWLAKREVQYAFKSARNQCIYEPVRKVVKAALRSDYEFAKFGATPQSESLDYSNNLKISDRGVAFIKQHENFSNILYLDVAGHCSIGYGTMVHRGGCDGTEPDEYKSGISQKRAEELLRIQIGIIERVVNSRVMVSLTQSEFDALVSFSYNVGTGAFKKSTLLKKLNNNEKSAVPGELKKWVKADGKTIPGLVKRRAEEVDMFTHGLYAKTSSIYTSSFDVIPRGIRNNNPGNIEINDRNDWEGKIKRENNTDGRFEQFISYAHGVRALIILLKNYILHERNTITKIFSAYAPPNENNTRQYINFISKRLNVGSDDVLPLTKMVLKELAKGIATMENGRECISDDEFEKGWSLIGEKIRNTIPDTSNPMASYTSLTVVQDGTIMDPFYRDSSERPHGNRGRDSHLGCDYTGPVSGDRSISDPRRGLPVYAAILETIPLSELNNVRAFDKSSKTKMSGLSLSGSGDATLTEAKIVYPPWDSSGEGSYGDKVGFSCIYSYANNSGGTSEFTLFIEFLHLISEKFLPKDSTGRKASLSEWNDLGRGIGLGPAMVNGSVVAPGFFTGQNVPLVGYLGASQTPHVHIQVGFYNRKTYEMAPKIRIDPAVVIY
ncbi:Phage lysozyme [anaerobic digester metagenome]